MEEEIYNDDNIFELLDDNILDDLERENVKYNDFYCEKVDTVNIFFVYTNKNNDIYHIKKIEQSIENNMIQKFKLIELINTYKIHNNIKHKPISLLQYNINIPPSDVVKYLKNNDKYSFLDIKKNIDTILWSDTISYFKHLNGLYIIYNENIHIKKNNQTKKITIKSIKRKKRKTRKQ
jgi:hypothetical protein